MTAPLQQRDLFTRRWRKQLEPQKEVALHIQLASMLHWCIRPDVIWRHVPNGEHRDPRTAQKLKAMGVLPGSADLEFFYKTSPDTHPSPRILFLELKIPGGKLSTEQASFALAMKLIGAEYHIARSIDEAIAILGQRGLLRHDVTVCGKQWSRA